MKNTLDTIKEYAAGITGVLLSIIGLLVISQVVFGSESASIDVIGNLQDIVNGFVGKGASLAGSYYSCYSIVGLLGQSKK